MKNAIKILAILIIGINILSLQSCKKYEDGPLLSLRCKVNRLTGEWELTGGNQTKTTQEPTVIISNVVLKIEKEGSFDIAGLVTAQLLPAPLPVTFAGEWRWLNNKEDLGLELTDTIPGIDFGFNGEMMITRLTNKELQTTDEFGETWEFEKK